LGHRDPFDRIIAATAIISNLKLLSADPVFDSLEPRAGLAGRIW
jgi:PIN domain nuclease of toxin-antitoxin system